MERGCEVFDHVPTVFLPFFVAWVVALGLWLFNTLVRNVASSNNLHRMLTCLPLVEAIYTFLCIFYYGSCPWGSFPSQLVAAALLMVVILKEPLNLLCLLLVAKGWHITREQLHHGENRVVVVSVIMLYASVVCRLFGNSLTWLLPILLAYVLMFLNIVLSIHTNLRILKSQLLAMHSLNIEPLTTPAYAKYVMFQRLALATFAYVALELALRIGSALTAAPNWAFFLAHQLIEFSVAAYIGLTFRARPLHYVFQQLQDFGLQLVRAGRGLWW
jgi:hypothetical protein